MLTEAAKFFEKMFNGRFMEALTMLQSSPKMIRMLGEF
jgi:hypothetical protein